MFYSVTVYHWVYEVRGSNESRDTTLFRNKIFVGIYGQDELVFIWL